MKAYAACAECGHEKDTMDTPCPKCGSIRVVRQSVLQELLGPDWRKFLDKPKADSPQTKKT